LPWGAIAMGRYCHGAVDCGDAANEHGWRTGPEVLR